MTRNLATIALCAALTLAAATAGAAEREPPAWLFAATVAVDTISTSRALRADSRAVERNPLLGERPSDADLALATAAAVAAWMGAERMLPDGWRASLLSAALASEADTAAQVAGYKGGHHTFRLYAGFSF